MDIPHFVYPSFDGHLEYFHFLSTNNNIVKNFHVQIFFIDIYFYFSWINIEKWILLGIW